jgi:hypothetical protein
MSKRIGRYCRGHRTSVAALRIPNGCRHALDYGWHAPLGASGTGAGAIKCASAAD